MPAQAPLERLAFDSPVSVGNGQGGQRQGWKEQFQSRAHIRFLRGGETVIAARLSGTQPVVVTIPNHEAARAVTTEWRIRDARTGTIYNIRTNPVQSDDRRWLEITAESGVAQ